MTQCTLVKLHAGRRQRVKRCTLPQAKAESLLEFGKKKTKSAVYRRAKMARRTSGTERRQFGRLRFFFFFTLSLTQAHARTPTHVCGGSHSRTSGHVHGRLQEFCVYSGNKKWARNVNSGLSDCRRTVAVIDFYKHPLQTSVWAERATAGHTHSSRGQRERGTGKKKNSAEKTELGNITWERYRD